MGSGGNGTSRRKNTKKRGRDELPSVGIGFRRSSFYRATRHNKHGMRRLLSNTVINKYANRRTSWFKTNCRPQKAYNQRAITQSHEELWSQTGFLYRVGDIVSIRDDDDGQLYFAQIRCLISDSKGGRFAFLTWMIPKKSADDVHKFSSEHFFAGVPDMEKYPLQVCEFVEHGMITNPDSVAEQARKLHEMYSRMDLVERVKEARNEHFSLVSFDEKLEPRKLPPC